MTRRIAIIGGGISALSTAYYLVARQLEEGSTIVVFERSPRLGSNSTIIEIETPEGTAASSTTW